MRSKKILKLYYNQLKYFKYSFWWTTKTILYFKLFDLVKINFPYIVSPFWQRDNVGSWKSNNRLFCRKNSMSCKSVKLDKKGFIGLT